MDYQSSLLLQAGSEKAERTSALDVALGTTVARNATCALYYSFNMILNKRKFAFIVLQV